MKVNISGKQLKTLAKKIVKRFFRYRAEPLPNINKKDEQLISSVRRNNLTYLSVSKLASIIKVCRDIENKNLSGIFIESGCALGGSTILISKIKSNDRPLFVYDVFGMIPPPTDQDGQDVQKRYEIISQGKSKGLGGNQYYGYEENLYEKVQENLSQFYINEKQHNVFLIKGLLQETMYVENSVAFAHIDVDWYDPVKTCLERIVPRLVVGGSIILDDYHDWSGCSLAVDEYFYGKSSQFIMDDSYGSLKITRINKD